MDWQVKRIHHFFRVVVPFTVRKPFRFCNPCNPSKQVDKLWGLSIFSASSLWSCLVWYTSLLGFANHAIPQNGLASYEGSPVFFMSLFLHCLIWYTSLFDFAIHAIPQNRWTSYETYPSFQHHHSGTALYGMQALLASEFLGYLIRNPSILRHLARVHKPYSHYDRF